MSLFNSVQEIPIFKHGTTLHPFPFPPVNKQLTINQFIIQKKGQKNDPRLMNSGQKNIQKIFSTSIENSEATCQIMEYSLVKT